jgi:hypothetical protein
MPRFPKRKYRSSLSTRQRATTTLSVPGLVRRKDEQTRMRLHVNVDVNPLSPPAICLLPKSWTSSLKSSLLSLIRASRLQVLTLAPKVCRPEYLPQPRLTLVHPSSLPIEKYFVLPPILTL